jgi:hypothetical protein
VGVSRKSQYQTRTYIGMRRKELVKLFNSTYECYAGLVPRTEDYCIWAWARFALEGIKHAECFLNLPLKILLERTLAAHRA